MNANKTRFVLIENNPEFSTDEETCWYWDTERMVAEEKREKPDWPWIAIQCYRKKDPNQFIRIPADQFRILFTDQAEYYFVCSSCYAAYSRMQWSGSTHGVCGWMEWAEEYKENHAHKKGWCEFCDPAFGSGGWTRE